MTRKDYETIARAFAAAGDNAAEQECLIQDIYPDDPGDAEFYGKGARETLYRLASELSDALEQENPRFDRARFFAACRLEPVA